MTTAASGPDLHEQALAWSRRLLAYRADCWTFIRESVWTKDEADVAEPVKPFPVAVCLSCRRYLGSREASEGCRNGADHARQPLLYLEYVVRGWQRGHPLSFPAAVQAYPKPRRMRMSWAMVAAHGWLALFRPYAAVYIVSSKQEKSAELVERFAHILRMLPAKAGWPAGLVPKWTLHQSPPRLVFPELGSALTGVAEGADQLRQYTATAILADEVATWTWPRATYTAMQPCIEGGGQVTLVSSAYPGFWRQFVSGELTA